MGIAVHVMSGIVHAHAHATPAISQHSTYHFARVWIWLCSATLDMSLAYNFIQQMRISQFYCNNLQLIGEETHLISFEACLNDQVFQTTFKSAFRGIVNVGPRSSPMSDSFLTTRWCSWLTSVMLTVERFCSKSLSSSSSSSSLVVGCRYTLAVSGSCNTLVKHIGGHFTS